MLVGREVEKQRLNKVYQSAEAEFVVLYGRRRVGKTYLIRQFFDQRKCIFFQATGLQKGALRTQLEHFTQALADTFTHGISIKPPASWEDAFNLLTRLINAAKLNRNEKIVIFLDELPWMASRRAGLLEALDYYWNHYWSKNPKIVLVICGSSASWLIKNIIYNRGGLHNRCTCEIKLDSFTLVETQVYLSSKGVKLNKNHVLELYMALGGVPYYLKYVEPGASAAENIQRILFEKNSPLRNEFSKLFQSLFTNAEVYIELIQIIAQKKMGVDRVELERQAKLSQGGGRLTQRLSQLIQTNFVESYLPLGKERGEYYKVIDEFCLFYLYWLFPIQNKRVVSEHWIKQIEKPLYHVWAGYAFEAICYKHIEQIIKALDIKASESISSWRLVKKEPLEHGVQIDLLIDRSDDAITLCEIKYTGDPFVINASYAEALAHKIEILKQATRTKKQVFLALISANGVKRNQYSDKMIDKVVTLNDLFVR